MTQKIEKRQCIEKATQEAFTVVNKKETETRKKQVKEERIPQSTKTDVLFLFKDSVKEVSINFEESIQLAERIH